MTPRYLIAALLVAALPAAADMYKWVDEKGVTHFSQTPPDAKDAQTLDVRTAPASSPSAAAAAEAKKDEAKPEMTEERKKRRAEVCKAAKDALAKLESPDPVVRYGAKGEQIMIDDDERPGLIEEAKKNISLTCGD